MTEKRKWFDPKIREPLPVPTRLRLQSVMSSEDCTEFLGFLDEFMRRNVFARRPCYGLWRHARLRPEIRLKINLTRTIERLVEDRGTDFMRAALEPVELEALVLLARINGKWQEMAQSLMNVPERYQLWMSVKGMFDEERSRKWQKPEEPAREKPDDQKDPGN